ncbi:hypothetical protein F8M41_020684 [Gigaspora margarita]|uniref:Uncharacterized protein n=1 Tax=Gigaspora margarita TaxID=4874 RepID=A0A8H4AI35_GIGMA|nr:hypothetical protein F8M41_020684 [Gigaspora margarita]
MLSTLTATIDEEDSIQKEGYSPKNEEYNERPDTRYCHRTDIKKVSRKTSKQYLKLVELGYSNETDEGYDTNWCYRSEHNPRERKNPETDDASCGLNDEFNPKKKKEVETLPVESEEFEDDEALESLLGIIEEYSHLISYQDYPEELERKKLHTSILTY